MSKVCFLTVQWLEEARYTADNLLIAKMMSNYGKPLNPDSTFYVGYDSSSDLFWEALEELFKVERKVEEEEKIVMLLSNPLIEEWIHLSTKIQESSMFEAFRMVQIGLESIADSTSQVFDGEMQGAFQDNGFLVTIKGCVSYILYHEFLEDILLFLKDLERQLHIWREHYEHIAGTKRNQDHAS